MLHRDRVVGEMVPQRGAVLTCLDRMMKSEEDVGGFGHVHKLVQIPAAHAFLTWLNSPTAQRRTPRNGDVVRWAVVGVGGAFDATVERTISR